MTLRQRLLANFILVALAAVLLATLAGALLARSWQIRSATRTVLVAAELLAPSLGDGVAPDSLREAIGGPDMRLLLVEPGGTVVADSAEALRDVQLPLDAELLAPRAAPSAQRLRLGDTLFYLAPLDVTLPDAPEARLLLAIPAAAVQDSPLWLLPALLLSALLGLLVAALLAWFTARRLAAPLETLHVAASRVAAGEYDVRLELTEEVIELAELQRAFDTMVTEVRRTRLTQRDFLANVSHDLRTPLTSIQGFSQALMDGAVPPEQIARVSSIIYGEASRLTRLVQDLLDLARIEAGRFSMVQRDITMNTVLERCTELVGAQAEAVGVSFDSRIPRRALPVHGDAERLEQVVTNLMDNAITYAKRGGGHVELEAALGGVRGHSDSNGNGNGGAGAENPKLGRWWIEVKVSDDGPRIPDEQKAQLFEHFYQGKGKVGRGTPGLGLAIAREIVQAHGGDIQVHDAPRQGTEFVVRLPMKMR